MKTVIKNFEREYFEANEGKNRPWYTIVTAVAHLNSKFISVSVVLKETIQNLGISFVHKPDGKEVPMDLVIFP